MASKRYQLTAKDIKISLFKIKPSPKHKGIGVFALRDIKKGTLICDAKKVDEDYFVPWEEFDKLDRITQQTVVDFCAQDKDGYYGPIDLNYTPVPLQMNHHCSGNVGCDEKCNFVAIKNIKDGEELCFDYALAISNPDYCLKCNCGDTRCRKLVTGNDWLDKNFQKKNYKHMSPLMRGLVDKLNKKGL